MKKTETKELIISLRDECVNKFNTVKGEFIELEKGYLALMDEQQKKDLKNRGKSHITQKIIKAKVRKIERDIMKTYFSTNRLAQIEIEGREQLTEVLQKKLDRCAKKLNLYTLLRPVIRDLLIYGTCVFKIHWSANKNSLIVTPKKIDRVLVDPYASSYFDAKYFVDRFYMTKDEIQTTFKGKLKGFEFSSMSKNSLNLDVQPSKLGEYKRYEVYEIYRKTKDGWKLSTMIDDFFVRVDEPLKDGHPFIFGIAYPQFIGIDERGAIASYGDSYVEPMIALQKQFIVRRNQQMDAIFQQLNQRFLTTRDSGLRDDELFTNKRKIVVSSLDTVRELPTPNINQSIFDVNKIDEEIQEVGGLPKLNQGISSSTDPRSATGMNLLNESGNATIDDIITGFNESAFEPMIFRMTKLIYKYEVSEDFIGVDRSKDIEPLIVVNAGVGVAGVDMQIGNIDSGVALLNTSINIAKELGREDKVNEYFVVLDELIAKKVEIVGIKNIENKIRKESLGGS